MVSSIDLIEHGFSLACGNHEETHQRWRALHHKLTKLRGTGVPYDAGDHDARIDCLLREMEADQLQYIQSTGEQRGHPTSRTKLQIQLTRYWICSCYEMLRTTAEAIDKDGIFYQNVNDLKLKFAAFRIPISKQEPHQSTAGTKILDYFPVDGKGVATVEGEPFPVRAEYTAKSTYRVKALLDSETGSIGFVVYDGRTQELTNEPRAKLSELLLNLDEIM